ncbi:hypothetical protein EH31_09335 [Erythrobacter longus]|uniref:Uncharacterized protein n=1 Tax=Erythrobacter longus TaxID=1044 RepID=A0A074M6B5_ERYLO|nr:hypothetical protein EH31_09335 [Erythrobacter longus]
MAEQQFFAAAVFAILGWLATCALAIIRSKTLVSDSSKTLCWFVPAIGLPFIIYLVYEGLYGPAGGFRYFAMSVVGIAFYALCILLPFLQLLVGLIAKAIDQSGE